MTPLLEKTVATFYKVVVVKMFSWVLRERIILTAPKAMTSSSEEKVLMYSSFRRALITSKTSASSKVIE